MPDKSKKNKASKFRMMRPVQGQYFPGQAEGSVSTHISSVFESDGKYFVAPTITNKKAPYAGYQPQSFGEAYRAGEAIPFDSFDEAMFFSQNYKLPKHFDNMKKSKYKNGGKGSKTYLDSQRKRVTGSPIIPGMNFESDATMFGSPLLDSSYMQMMLDDQPGNEAPFDYRSIMNEDFLLNQYQSDIRNLEPTPIKNQEYFENVPGASGAIGGGTTYFKNGGKGLWANIHAKRKRIAAGSGERMRTPGSEGAPTNEALKRSQAEHGGMHFPETDPLKGKGAGSGLIRRADEQGDILYKVEGIQEMYPVAPGEDRFKAVTRYMPYSTLNRYYQDKIQAGELKYGGKVLKYPDGGKFDYNSIYEGQVLPDSVDRSIPNTFYIQPFYNETTKEMMASGEQGFQGPQKRFNKQELSKSLPYIGQHVESTLLPIREKMLNAKTKEEYDSLQKEYNDLMPASNLSRGISNYLDSIAVQGFGFSKGDQVKIKKDMGGPAFKADYEAEDGEVIVGNVSLDRMYNGGMLKSYGTGGMYSLSGPTHAEGGMGIINNDSNPSYVFSNNPKLKVPKQFAKGGTYADAAKGMSKSLENIAEMRMGGEGYDRATANLMEPLAMKEFSNLYDAQEQFKIDNNIGGNPINTAFNGGGFDPNKYQNSGFSLPTGLGLDGSSGGIQMPGNFGAGAESAGQSNKQGLPSWMIGANLLGPATNILGGLFGQAPTMDLGREREEDYRDFSPIEQQYASQQARGLAGLRAGVQGSGATGAQLRAGVQAGTSAAQNQAGQFYTNLAQQQAESDRQTDATNRGIRDQNLQREMMEGQFAAQNDPMNKLTAGIGQLGQTGAKLGMDYLRLQGLGTANYGAFGDFLKGIIG